MNTISKAYRQCQALIIVADLVKASRWFECTPLPNDIYDIKVNDGGFQLPWSALDRAK